MKAFVFWDIKYYFHKKKIYNHFCDNIQVLKWAWLLFRIIVVNSYVAYLQLCC
jgi:hypothetical protein